MESFKQKRANLLNDNPIASHGSWISKHSIAAGSPLQQGGSKKSPLYQDKDQKSGEYTVTETTPGLSGEDIATRREAVTPGATVERLAKPGTPEYAKWEAAVAANPSIEDKYKPKTVTQERDVELEQPKQYVNIFKGYKGGGVDERTTTTDSLSWPEQKAIAKSINMPLNVAKKQFTKVTGFGFRKKGGDSTSSSSGSQNVSEWTNVD